LYRWHDGGDVDRADHGVGLSIKHDSERFRCRSKKEAYVIGEAGDVSQPAYFVGRARPVIAWSKTASDIPG
jgi:hypothetical protein